MPITPDTAGSAFLSYSWSSYVGYGGDYAVGCHLPGPTHVSSFTLQNRALVWFSYDDSTTKMRVAVVGPTTWWTLAYAGTRAPMRPIAAHQRGSEERAKFIPLRCRKALST